MRSSDSRLILRILESVDRDGARPQRSRALEVGIALGLVNAYLRFCIRKGYLKAKKIPARGYRYMLTPKGLAEKSRLALSRLSDSLIFVRAAKNEYADLMVEVQKRQWSSVVIVGSSILAEICALSALEHRIRIVAVVNATPRECRLAGAPVYRDFSSVMEKFDGAVVAELDNPGGALMSADAALGEDRVQMPPFLRAILPKREVG